MIKKKKEKGVFSVEGGGRGSRPTSAAVQLERKRKKEQLFSWGGGRHDRLSKEKAGPGEKCRLDTKLVRTEVNLL